jgi:hypothetical protein
VSIVGSQAIILAVRRFWWAVPIAGLLAWALILRGDLAAARADLAAEQAAHRESALGWQLATATAAALDLANKVAIERRQAEESRRIADDFEARIADARARAAASVRAEAPAADQGGRGSAPVPGIPDPALLADEAAGQGGFPSTLSPSILSPDDALIATEQAIQLDELINWVEAQARIGATGER